MPPLRLNVACDTPLGVEFVTLQAAGKGAIVTERLVEKFAEARRWTPEECELVAVTDEATGHMLWPPSEG